MASYGDYNGKIVIDENKENLDSKNTKSTSAVKRAVVGNYTSSEMRKGPYLGYIIKKYDVISDDDEEEGFFSFLGFGKSTITVYKVRIPELDAHIPEPDIENPQILTDKQYIDMIYDWKKDGRERLIITKTFRRDVIDSIKNNNLSKYVDDVLSLDPLTSVIICNKKTRGSGILAKIGKDLKNKPIGIFHP